MMHPADLPDNIDALKAMVLAAQSRADQQVGVIIRKEERIVQLDKLVTDYKRALFGVRSEKVCLEQFELAFEDIETAPVAIQAEDGADDRLIERRPRPRKANQGSLPGHLPRIEEVVKPDSTICDCGADRQVIGENISERFDIIPAQFRVIVTRRPKYTCRTCEEGIIQVPAPAHLIVVVDDSIDLLLEATGQLVVSKRMRFLRGCFQSSTLPWVRGPIPAE